MFFFVFPPDENVLERYDEASESLAQFRAPSPVANSAPNKLMYGFDIADYPSYHCLVAGDPTPEGWSLTGFVLGNTAWFLAGDLPPPLHP